MYADARDAFGAVQRIRPDAACAFNRLICAYMVTSSVEQADALKQSFRELLAVPDNQEAVGGTQDASGSDTKVCTPSHVAQDIVRTPFILLP